MERAGGRLPGGKAGLATGPMTARRTARRAASGIAVPPFRHTRGRVEPLLSASVHFGCAAGVTACQPLARPATLTAPLKGTYNQATCLYIHDDDGWLTRTRQTGTVMPVPTPHRQPRYRAIADELRRRIIEGAIPAGSLLPSEGALTAEFRVARGTIREAINVLRTEGLIVTEHGRGSYARPNLAVRRLGHDRYRPKPSQRSLQNGPGGPHGVDNADRIEAAYREVPASPEVAALFEVDLGTMMLERRLLVCTYGQPQHLTMSYYLLGVVAGTPVADPSREPWPGGHVAQLESLGITATTIRETVRARMPTAAELDLLRLRVGVPLLVITRQTRSRERVVEAASQIVLPADRVDVEYELSI
ncbi:GntR family transcriptional regulator [Plantactinospora sp. KLBMP9567]|uniref:GntR family transcriptional regulator n=1 Tax=Plantactinospora sp. KLBMP9567 TaxID=3085900 RepID=UPI0039909D96